MNTVAAPRLLIIGLDGVNLDLIQRLLPVEVMPTLNRLIANGAAGDLRSVIPTHSAAAWASFASGQLPAGHGVFDFKVRQPDGHYRHAKPDLQHTVWHLLGQAGYRVGVYNFPVSYPPDPVNGWMVSGMLTPSVRHIAYPAQLSTELATAFPDYPIDVEWMLYENRPRDLLLDLITLTHQHAEAARHLFQQHPVDVFAAAFIATDRAQHAIWSSLDPRHPAHDPETAEALRPGIHLFYQAIDQAVGSLLELAGPQTTVILLSDHGFQAVAWQFHVDGWLEQQGWLARRPLSGRFERWLRRLEPPGLRHLRQRLLPDASRFVPALAPGGAYDWARTSAFCPWNFQQGIRLNLVGRDPNGIVSPGAEADKLLEEISAALRTLQHPGTGAPVIANLWRVSPSSPGTEPNPDQPDGLLHLAEMPDLLFDLNVNFTPGLHRPGLFEPTGWVSGDHNLTGLVVANGSGVTPGRIEAARLIDISPSILQLAGLPVPGWMHGSPLANFTVGPFPGQGGQPSEQIPASSATTTDSELTPEEESQLLQQLRDLGYL